MEFKPKITPEQVNEAIKKDAEKQKTKAKGKSQKKEAPEKEKPRKAKPAEFPVKARINDYGFLNFKAGVLAALGWTKGMDLTIEKNPDGSITVRKA